MVGGGNTGKKTRAEEIGMLCMLVSPVFQLSFQQKL